LVIVRGRCIGFAFVMYLLQLNSEIHVQDQLDSHFGKCPVCKP